MLRYRSSCLSPLLVFMVTILASPPAKAQCILDDNLDGPCCEIVDLTLPDFPPITLDTKYICWKDCGVRFAGTVKATLRLRPKAPGHYLVEYTVTNKTGEVTAWTGKLIATYVRTFAESREPGKLPPDFQVWRFLLNGDLSIHRQILRQYGNDPCVVPTSYHQYGWLHVSGYADWALDCATGEWSVAYALGHESDHLEHWPAFSCRPGTFNQNRSYNWVGPAAAFECRADLEPASGSPSGAFRHYDFTQTLDQICQTEQPSESGRVEDFVMQCISQNGGTSQYKLQEVVAGGNACGSGASSQFDFFFLSDLVMKSIGAWTDPDSYPGEEQLLLDRGIFSYGDGCSSVRTGEYFLGVHTRGGFDVLRIISGDLEDTTEDLVDLGNARGVVDRAPGPTRVIGKRYATDRLMYFNIVPF